MKRSKFVKAKILFLSREHFQNIQHFALFPEKGQSERKRAKYCII